LVFPFFALNIVNNQRPYLKYLIQKTWQWWQMQISALQHSVCVDLPCWAYFCIVLNIPFLSDIT